MVECEMCSETGLTDGEDTVYVFGDGPFCRDHLVPCPDCAGHGTVEGAYEPDGFGCEAATMVDCPTCHGGGAIPDEKLRQHLGLEK